MAGQKGQISDSRIGRVIDYIFGRNSLIGMAEIMLLLIAGYATWHGMRDFIVGVSSTAVQPQGGGLSISNDLLVAAVCIVLTFLMWLALRETFGEQRRLRERLITAPLYIFLALWSIGFGYGFWWSLIAGEEATRTGLSGLQEDARDAGSAIAARLDAVRSQLDQVVSWSDSQMTREDTSGGSCGVASGAGRGPLYNARRGVRDSVTTLRDGMLKNWLEPMQADVKALQTAVAIGDGGTVEERQKAFEAKASEIRGKARNIASRSNELGKSTATEMRALAAAVSVAPGTAGFSCYDPTLAQRLKQAADQADQPAVIRLRLAEFNEGPAGVANAIKKLWANMGSYLYSLTAYIFTGGESTGNAKASGEPITGRDMIALLATIGIDLGLLAMAAMNPVPPFQRRDALTSNVAELHMPHEEVVKALRPAFRAAIVRAPGDNTNFEWVTRHFIHHGSSSYFVIPNLYSADTDDDEKLKALAMNQLAGVLDDLKLIKALTPEELSEFGREEMRDSYTDLTPFREMKAGNEDRPAEAASPDRGIGRWLSRGKALDRTFRPGSGRIRNHALLSKAQRVLDIAGWSEKAQGDVEIYRLVDTEGLTPLLMVMNDAESEAEMLAGARQATVAAGRDA